MKFSNILLGRNLQEQLFAELRFFSKTFVSSFTKYNFSTFQVTQVLSRSIKLHFALMTKTKFLKSSDRFKEVAVKISNYKLSEEYSLTDCYVNAYKVAD